MGGFRSSRAGTGTILVGRPHPRRSIRLLAVVSATVMAASWIGPTGASAATGRLDQGVASATGSAVAAAAAPSPAARPVVEPRGDVTGRTRSTVPILALLQPSTNPVALSGAQVQVFKLNATGKTGRRLGQGRTGRRGAVSVRLPAIPGRVLVKVTGGRTTRKGKAFGQPFAGSLTAVMSSTSKSTTRGVKRFFPGGIVSLPSTVLAEYGGARPLKKWSSSKSKVSKFLGLPYEIASFAYDYGLNTYSQDLFNTKTFLAQAKKAGGVDKFVTKLARDIAKGKAAHAFHPTARSLDTRGAMEAFGNIASVGTVLGWTAKLGFKLFGVFTGQSKSDEEQALTNEFQEINSQLVTIEQALAQLQAQVAQLQSVVNEVNQSLSAGVVQNATAAAAPYMNGITGAWTQMLLLQTAVQQLCDSNGQACVGSGPPIANVIKYCAQRSNSSTMACETINDDVDTINTVCEEPSGGDGGIQNDTLGLAYAIGGAAAGSSQTSDDQGLINSLAQAAVAANHNVLNPPSLEYIRSVWAWYYIWANLGDAMYAGYLSLNLGSRLPGTTKTTVTTQYIMQEVNYAVAPTMNMLAGTYPTMPAGTALVSNTGGSGTAYVWATQVGMNSPQNWATSGGPWTLTPTSTETYDQLASIAGTYSGSPVSASPVISNVPVPHVETLLPAVSSDSDVCDSDNGAKVPAKGTCTALIIGEDSNGDPELETEITVQRYPLPSWQVPDVPNFSQLDSAYDLAGPGTTFGQWLMQSAGFEENLLTRGLGSTGLSGNYVFWGSTPSGWGGFLGGCVPSGNSDCLISTWAASSPNTYLYDLNNGKEISNQSGNFGPGCSGGGINYSNGWAGLPNWTTPISLLISTAGTGEWGQIPCGTYYAGNHGNSVLPGDASPPNADVYGMPIWQQLNGVNNQAMPPTPGTPGEWLLPQATSAPNLSPDGLLTLFTQSIPSGYCYASYSSSLTSGASACTTPRKKAADVDPS